ncbi:hypothetical protein ACA910_015794 [Epithemia clementina (nom. ined.)]
MTHVELTDLSKQKKEYIVPTVFGQQLCHRPLLTKEQAMCFDIPVVTLNGRSDQMIETLISNITAPVKIADCLAQDLRNAFLQLMATQQERIHLKRLHHLANWDTPQSDKLLSARHHKHIKPMFTNEEHTPTCTLSWATQTISRMATFSLQNYDVQTTATEKAVKRDDAEVPEHLWNFRIALLLGTTELNQQQYRSANILRQAMLRWWKRNVLRSWGVWWRTHQASIRSSSSDDWTLLWERGVKA